MWQADDQGTLRQRMLGQSQNQMPDMMAQYVPPPLIDQAPVGDGLKDQMLGQIMQDNPRDKYSKKKEGGDSGMMGGLLKMAMSMFGGGG